MSRPLTLGSLLRAAGHGDRVPADAEDVLVREVTHDSRRVRPGTLFVAIRGSSDGADFAGDAVRNGACAVVAASAERRLGVPWVVVDDDRAALGDLAAALHGHPSERLFVIGVTGTNGKTTTTDMAATVFETTGRPAALLGTIEARWPGGSKPASRTTPEASDLQAMFEEFAAADCGHVVMEVSSHAVDLKRLRGTRLSAVAFTNLSQDHLDWHGDLESYFQSKRRLFTELATNAPAVLCVDDEHARKLARELRAAGGRRVVTCGFAPDADLRIRDFVPSEAGSSFRLVGVATRWSLPCDVDVAVRLAMPARHDAMNAACAASLCLLAGVAPDEVAAGLAAHRGVPGRLEPVAPQLGDEIGEGVRVLVDYAHTPGALKSALRSVRETCEGRVICVFGCGGDRDREKRAPMGRVVGALADVAVATSDNPRGEDPDAILSQVQEGLAGSAAEVHVERDRRAAIALALRLARAGDVVVVAGKGHETTQEVAGRRSPFDDREVVRQLRRPKAGAS